MLFSDDPGSLIVIVNCGAVLRIFIYFLKFSAKNWCNPV